MELKKRGLSDVVTVTLIILLAVAAVVIVWAFVRSTLEEAGKEVTLTCVTANLKAVSCTATTGATVVRNDATEGTITSVKLVSYDTTGTSTTQPNTCGTVTLEPLGQQTCTLTTPAPVAKVAVAPVINGKTCPLSTPITCA